LVSKEENDGRRRSGRRKGRRRKRETKKEEDVPLFEELNRGAI
jgi:hypothetical protein